MQAKPYHLPKNVTVKQERNYLWLLFSHYIWFYLVERLFIVRIDHHSLALLLGFKNIEWQLARWIEELSQYNMAVKHRSGKAHGNADGLSRIT